MTWLGLPHKIGVFPLTLAMSSNNGPGPDDEKARSYLRFYNTSYGNFVSYAGNSCSLLLNVIAHILDAKRLLFMRSIRQLNIFILAHVYYQQCTCVMQQIFTRDQSHTRVTYYIPFLKSA